MYLHKKGQVINIVIVLIVILVSAAVIFLIVQTVFGVTITKNVDRRICNLSVNFKYVSGFAFGGLKETGKLSCKTEEVEIKTKDEKKVMKTLAGGAGGKWGKER